MTTRLPFPYRDEIPVAQALAERARDALDWSAVVATATPWVQAVRDNPAPFWALESLLREYPISSAEGLSLMRLAEALLRVPDAETAIALTADQLGRADFEASSNKLLASLSSNAIALSKRFLPDEDDPPGLMQRLGSKTVVAATVRAIQLLGRQFVLGRNIREARSEASGQRRAQPNLRFSYDMLGEGARTEEDAERYLAAYRHAIEAIGGGRRAQQLWAADGISIKLSALFSRYHASHRERVLAELLPRVQGLVDQAAAANINLTIDAEESDRLELSLDILDALAAHVHTRHADWGGLGLAVQAYQTRSLEVIDAVAAIARQRRLRFMVRLVKGAYWDGEIKRAQEEGLPGYPVFTHKHHTDIAYLACAQRMVEHREQIFAQFATHNAGTVAGVIQLAQRAGAAFEMQRLHGMGEGVYRELLKDPSIACRVYAPVGEHRDLLAYLVRRLLENGANSSFVHQLSDETVSAELLLASPLRTERAPGLALPIHLYGDARRNSGGADLACEAMLWPLVEALQATRIEAVREASLDDVDATMTRLSRGLAAWQARPVTERAAMLERAADLLEARGAQYCGLIVAEGRRVLADAVSEVREAVDFCRYYAQQARCGLGDARPSEASSGVGAGVFVCISPWNFPLAIFAGQVVAALVAGNTVAAKPAEQTPVVARHFVALLHEAGVPEDAVQWIHGRGETVGAALTAHARTAGVCFTGSTAVARIIQRTLARRDDAVTPLIAETGGLNAMIVDSTALPEQVVDAVVQSAFRSAGQRCSALRLLVLHASIADGVLRMLQGAMKELHVGDARCIDTDVGPVIDEEAHANLQAHIARLTREAKLVARTPVTSGLPQLVAPVAFELGRIEDLKEEVFGPVLHVVRWAGDVDDVVARINALGYGLTLGVQTRIDSRALRIAERAHVGNVYVNRNMVGAVVGVQPFGGEGLSGTGPKAGGPHYLMRFLQTAPLGVQRSVAALDGAPATLLDTVFDTAQASAWHDTPLAQRVAWVEATGDVSLAHAMRRQLAEQILPGPTGESNLLRLRPRGVFGLVVGERAQGIDAQIQAQCKAALACGNTVLIATTPGTRDDAQRMLRAWEAVGLARGAAQVVDGPWAGAVRAMCEDTRIAGLLVPHDLAVALNRRLSLRAGAIARLVTGEVDGRLWELCAEQTLTINTAAAGGNAALLAGVPPHTRVDDVLS